MEDKTEKKPLWSLDDLTRLANERLGGLAVDGGSDEQGRDGRISALLTPRNVRRLVGEGAVPKPYRDGRDAFYDESHLNALLSTRALMSMGVGTKALREMAADGYSGLLERAVPGASLDSALKDKERSADSGSGALNNAFYNPTAQSVMAGFAEPSNFCAPKGGTPSGALAFLNSLPGGVVSAQARVRSESAAARAAATPPALARREAQTGFGVRVSVPDGVIGPLTSDMEKEALEALRVAWVAAGGS